MTLHYDSQTDSLYIELLDAPSVDSREVSPDIVLDFDAAGRVVGIDIQHACTNADLSRLDAPELPRVPAGKGNA